MNKTFIFDLGKVIINLLDDDMWYRQLAGVCKEMELMRLKNAGFFDNFEKGLISEQEFIYMLKSIAINNSVADADILRAWNSILLDIPPHRIEMLKRLKNDYKLLLLSNTNSIHIPKIEAYSNQTFGENIIETCFHKAYYSYELNERKPHQCIYEKLILLENIDAHSCYFFDDKQENLYAPNAMGIHSYLVDKDISEIIELVLLS